MGRAKLRLQRLEPGAGRNTTYTKRRHGLTKKVSELSILCDIQIMLLTFSPGGRAAFFKSENSSIEEIITKFAHLSPQERAQRKLESLEVLKKAFKNLEHVINIKDPFGPDYHSVEDLTALAEILRSRLSDINYNLSCWTYMEEIESIEQLTQMKESLEKNLCNIWHCKDIHLSQQLGVQCTDQQSFDEQQMWLHSADQFQHGVDVTTHNEQLQLLSWLEHHKQNQDMQDLYMFHHGNPDCSGSIPFEGYSRAGDQINMSQPRHGHGHEEEYLMKVEDGHEHGYAMDLYRTGNEDGYLLDLANSGQAHSMFMDFIKSENDNRHTYEYEHDNSRQNGDACAMEMIRTGYGDDMLMDFINNHPEYDMSLDFSQTGNGHGISMDLINFANEHNISMDLVRAGQENGGLIEIADHYDTSMDLRNESNGQGNEHYITDKTQTERREILDKQMYMQHPNQLSTFPSLCDDTYRSQEHLEMLENILLSENDNFHEFHEYGNRISNMSAYDDYLYPQTNYISDDDLQNFGASRYPISVT